MNLLVVLEALLDERHVTRAGTKIGLSQPATSAALRRLRAIYNDPLLERSGRSMRLTPRGRDLLPKVRAALRTIEAALADEGPHNPALFTGQLRIATTDHLMLLLFPTLIQTLLEHAPNLEVRTTPYYFGVDAAILLGQDEADLVIAGYEPRPRGLHEEVLLREGIMCVVRRGHPALVDSDEDDPFPLDAFLSYPHVRVAYRDDPGPVARGVSKLGASRRVVMEVPSALVAPFIILQTDSVATLQTRTARLLAGLLPIEARALPTALSPEPHPEGGEIYMVWHERTQADATHSWVRSVLRDIAGKLPPIS